MMKIIILLVGIFSILITANAKIHNIYVVLAPNQSNINKSAIYPFWFKKRILDVPEINVDKILESALAESYPVLRIADINTSNNGLSVFSGPSFHVITPSLALSNDGKVLYALSDFIGDDPGKLQLVKFDTVTKKMIGGPIQLKLNGENIMVKSQTMIPSLLCGSNNDLYFAILGNFTGNIDSGYIYKYDLTSGNISIINKDFEDTMNAIIGFAKSNSHTLFASYPYQDNPLFYMINTMNLRSYERNITTGSANQGTLAVSTTGTIYTATNGNGDSFNFYATNHNTGKCSALNVSATNYGTYPLMAIDEDNLYIGIYGDSSWSQIIKYNIKTNKTNTITINSGITGISTLHNEAVVVSPNFVMMISNFGSYKVTPPNGYTFQLSFPDKEFLK